MPASTTSSQFSTPTPCNVGNGVVASSDGRWNQVDNNNMLQNTTHPQWNEMPPHSVVSVPVSASCSSEYANNVNNVNVISNEVVYPQNYINLPYTRNSGYNGYASFNPTRGINSHIINGQNLPPTQNGQIIGGPSLPNQLAPGSFISQSPGWTSNKTGGKKQKRIRTAFTTPQMKVLEDEYAKTRYLDRARRLEIADQLRLNERTIKIWFQNRRMKEKKDRAEGMADPAITSTSESSPEINNIQMLIHEQYPGINNEIFNQGNIYVEEYPVSMPAMSLPTSTPVQSSVQSTSHTVMSEEECLVQYQQNLPMQPYHPVPVPSSYPGVQELSPEEVPATTSAPSEITENHWDLSWIRPLDY